MKRMTMVLAVLMLTATIGYGNALQFKSVSSSAKWLMHVDVDAVNGSTLATSIMSDIPAERSAKFEACKTRFGMDPRKDISAFTLYGEEAGHDNAIAIVRGKFDAQKILTLIEANPAYEQIIYGNRPIQKWEDKGKVGYGCFADGNTLVMGGNLEQIKAALDVLSGTKGHLAADSSLAMLTPSTGGVLFFASADGLDGIQGGKNAPALKNAKNMSLAVSEQGGQLQAELKVTALNDESTEQVADTFRGMIAIGTMAQEQNPAMAKIVQAVKLTVEGQLVTVSLALPSADVADLIKTCSAQAKATHKGCSKKHKHPAE